MSEIPLHKHKEFVLYRLIQHSLHSNVYVLLSVFSINNIINVDFGDKYYDVQ